MTDSDILREIASDMIAISTLLDGRSETAEEFKQQ